MKYIEKLPEPVNFTAWKNGDSPDWVPSWSALDSDPAVKQELKDSLIAEQGAICSYCGIRINRPTSHIEHVKPRETFPEEDVNYQNLVASCSTEGKHRHCGNRKDNWYDPALFVSPLSPECEQKFQFSSDGKITPTRLEDPAAATTISRLGLDSPNLNAHRRNALEASGIFDDPALSDDELRRWAIGVVERAPDGNFTEFCFVISSVLSALIGRG